MAQCKILLVDDEPNVTSALSKVLRSQPYEILVARSGQSALAILHEHEIQVVVSDERMPGMSGSQLLATVRKLYPTTVRIMLTGHANTEAAIRAINEGEVYRFFSKPCNAEELSATIRQALEHHELQEKSRELLQEFRRKNSMIEELESRHPGIAASETDETGAWVIGDCDVSVDELLREMEREIQRGRC